MTLSREDRIRLIGPLAFHSFVIGAISKDEHFSVPFVYPLSLGLRYSQTPARKIRIDSGGESAVTPKFRSAPPIFNCVRVELLG